MSTGNQEFDSGSGEHATQPDPKYRRDEFFRCRPILFYKFLAAQVERQATSKGKRDRSVDVLRFFVLAAIRHPIVRVTIVVATIGPLAYWLLGFVADNPDKAVAVLTVALTLVAIVQWWTSHRQFQQAKVAAGQTDRMIGQMMLEQRAWLSIGPPTSLTWKENGVSCVIAIKNSGHTPARIAYELTYFHVGQAGVNGVEYFNNMFADLTQTAPKNMTIAPGGEMTLYFDPAHVDIAMIPKIKAGYERLFAICRVAYVDVFGVIRVSQTCGDYNHVFCEFWNYSELNHMD
ncbi:MAG: hypothetical protein WD875_11030 [Pirellulales bacterium]